MQTSLTGVIDNASNLQKESQKEREQLELQLHEAIQQNEQAEKVLQNILVELGITDDEMAHLSGLHKIGNSLQEKIVEFRQIYERKLEEINEVSNIILSRYFYYSNIMIQQYILQHAVHERTVQEIYAKLDAEAEARKDVEILLQSTKETLEGRHKDYETQIDTISCNFQMAITGKLDAENKVATLTEQKKVLIREVKSVRKKCEEQQQIIKEMKALNENLIKATRSVQHEQDIQRFQILQLQQQLDVANKAIQTAREAAVPSVSTGVIPEASLATVSQNTDHFEVLQEGTDKTVTTVISNIGEESSVTEEESHDGHLISTIVEPNSPPPDNANNNDVDLADTIKDAVLEREQIDDLVKSGSTFLASIPASWNEIDMISNSPSKEHTQQASGDGDGSSILPIENMRASTPVNISRKASNGELSTEISSTLPRRSTTSSADAESEDGKWDAPQSALKDLTWLSDEQSKLVQKRLEENGMNLQSDDSVTESATNTNANNNNIAGAASGASATFVAATQSATSAASSLLSGVSKVVLGSNSTSASNTNTTQSSSVTSDKKSYFSSMFSKTNEDEPHHQSSAVVQPLTITPATVLAGSSGESSHGITNNNSGNGGNNTGIMHCLRCHGTVQGPKLSTCKCSMPALAPEDLQSGSAMFSGFISKGSSVAGGLFKGVGGLMSGNTAAISSVHNSSGNSSGNVSQ